MEHATLSVREAEVLWLIAHGYTTGKIAAYLGVAPNTAREHRRRAYAKAGVATKRDATLWGRAHLACCLAPALTTSQHFGGWVRPLMGPDAPL